MQSSTASEPSGTPPVADGRLIPSWVMTWRLFDWALLVIIGLVCGAIELWAKPFCRPFSFADASISYEMKGSTFPSWSLIVISILPAVVYVAWIAVLPATLHKLTEINCAVVMQAEACVLAQLLTVPLKVYVGRLRPDFLSRLARIQLNATTASSGVDFCGIADKTAVDGRRSFPSGHASSAFGALVPLTLYIFYRLGNCGRWTCNRSSNNGFWRIVVAGVPLILSLLVAASRTRDNKHNFDDVLCGSVLGALAAIVSFYHNKSDLVSHAYKKEEDSRINPV